MKALDEVTCPLCASNGWPSSRMLAAYAADCGTAWSADGSYVNQGVSCRVISKLRLELELRDVLGVAS